MTNVSITPNELTAVVLAGGKGTRIAQLYPDVPKPMIPVAGQPFLFWVTEWLTEAGVRDIIYSVGHLASQIESWVAAQAKSRNNIRLRTVAEPSPLGTGGAIRNCLDICGPWVLAINGDSLVKADISAIAQQTLTKHLDGIIVGLPMEDTSRYGSLDMDEPGLLRGFFEKRPGAGLINAGIYLLRRDLLERFPAGEALSMEVDVIPDLLTQGASLGVAVTHEPFLDIGTPESVTRATDFVRAAFPFAK
jgi:NDP-sugar pyrophosphorylase family protein